MITLLGISSLALFAMCYVFILIWTSKIKDWQQLMLLLSVVLLLVTAVAFGVLSGERSAQIEALKGNWKYEQQIQYTFNSDTVYVKINK